MDRDITVTYCISRDMIRPHRIVGNIYCQYVQYIQHKYIQNSDHLRHPHLPLNLPLPPLFLAIALNTVRPEV
jgi:hypothetical protein